MRVLDLAAGIAALGLVGPGALSAQNFGDAAAKEKARRKAAETKTKKPAPTFTNDDLGRAGGGNANFPSGPDGAAAEGADKDKKDGTGAEKTEKSAAEKQAEAAALWRKNLDTANKNVAVYRDQVNRIQADLNDTSGGFYSARRTTLMNLQEETKKKLADAESLAADLEDQGRRSGYR